MSYFVLMVDFEWYNVILNSYVQEMMTSERIAFILLFKHLKVIVINV